jgi:hypothetical protein
LNIGFNYLEQDLQCTYEQCHYLIFHKEEVQIIQGANGTRGFS